MALSTWLALVGFFFVGGLTPGPAVMLVMGAATRYSFRPAMMAALGVASANVLWLALAASGAAVLALAFPTVFAAVKWVGLAVIVWLGVMQMRAPVGAVSARLDAAPPRGRLYASGLALQLANPLALITFAALIPGFFDASRPILPQYLTMVATITVLELNGLAVYSAFGTWIRRRLDDPVRARVFNVVIGLLLIAAGSSAVLTTL